MFKRKKAVRKASTIKDENSDVEVDLVETFSEKGNELSDFQDKVSSESKLSTSRKRRSISKIKRWVK